MTRDDLLKKGCEVAGMQWDGPEQLVLLKTPWGLHIHHPALPAYVAELLRDKVMRDAPSPWQYRQALDFRARDLHGPPEPEVGYIYDPLAAVLYYLSPFDHIAAALVALGHITEDEAREALR